MGAHVLEEQLLVLKVMGWEKRRNRHHAGRRDSQSKMRIGIGLLLGAEGEELCLDHWTSRGWKCQQCLVCHSKYLQLGSGVRKRDGNGLRTPKDRAVFLKHGSIVLLLTILHQNMVWGNALQTTADFWRPRGGGGMAK